MQRCLLIVILTCASSLVNAYDGFGNINEFGYQKERKKSYLTLDYGLKDDQNHSVLLSGQGEITSLYDARFGVSFIEVDGHYYQGFDVGVLFIHRAVVSPYVGIGLLISQLKRCNNGTINDECDQDITFAAYPEFGLYIGNRAFRVNVFARSWFGITGGMFKSTLFGIGIGVGL